jgi:hypothetical protein
MVHFDMQSLAHWLMSNGNAIAAMVTLGVAVFLVCCLECTDCSRRDKDEVFRRHEV